MAFAAEVEGFINAFGAMNKILGTKSSREAERARTDYTRALTDKTRWDMGESDRDAAGILGYADDRYGAINYDGSGGGDFNSGGTGGGPIVIDGVTITGDFKGVDPSMYNVVRGMAAGAKAAGLDRLDMTGGYEGGHRSHLSRHDLDFKGYAGDQLWNPEQRVTTARGGAAGGADRFGLYSFGEGITGNGSLHIGKSGARNPRSGHATPAAVWGYKGQLGGDASRAFTDPYERAFLRKFNARDLASAMDEGKSELPGTEIVSDVGSEAIETLGDISGRTGPRSVPTATRSQSDVTPSVYRDAIAAAESRGSGDYSAVNDASGALGRYQVMPNSLKGWAKGVFGRQVSPEEFLANPALQDQLFDAKFGESLQKYGNPRDAISVWFTGRPEAVAGPDESDGGLRNRQYIDKVMSNLGSGGAEGFRGLNSALAPEGAPPQFEMLQDILAAGGQEPLPEFGIPPARMKDDKLDLDVIQSMPDSKIPWYNRGSFGSDAYADINKIQSIQEAIATSPITAPMAPIPGGVSRLTPPYPDGTDVLDGTDRSGLIATTDARTKDNELESLRQPLPPRVPGEPRPEHILGNAIKDDALPGIPAGPTTPTALTPPYPASASPSTVSGLFQPAVPDPNLRPDVAAVPGTEAVSEVPEPTERPTQPAAAIPEEAASMGFDPLPQTSGHMDPVSQAGHETLTHSIRGTGNRRRQKFPQLLGRIFGAGRNMLGVEDEAVEVDDDNPRKDAFLAGVGGLNAELIDKVEDRVRAGDPSLSEEQVRMEVISTLWNYFNEQGQPDKADKVAFAAMQSYKQISHRYLAISQAALEDGDMETAVENYRAAYGLIPDGDVVDLVQTPDGKYQVTIKDADTGELKKTIIKTPDQIAADIMDTSPEIFDNLIKKKIQGAGSEPTAAEIAQQQENEWFAAGGLPNGTAPEAAVPEAPAATGPVGGTNGDTFGKDPATGEDLAIPTDTGDTGDIVTSDVTLTGEDTGAPEAIPVATPASAPTVPMSSDEFLSNGGYLSTIPPGARPAALTIWKLQQAAYDKWQKTQPSPEDVRVQQNVNQFFTDLATADPTKTFYPDERMLIGAGSEIGNLMLGAATKRNEQLKDDIAAAREQIGRESFAVGIDQTRDTPNVPPSPVPASSPIMGGERTSTIRNLQPVVPGHVTAEQLRRPINLAETPRPKGAIDADPVLAANMTSDSQRTSYLSAVKDRNTANAEFDEGFEPKPIDLSKLSDPTGSGEGLSLRQIFIGDETTPEPAGMLGDYIAFNNLEGASPDNRANAVMLSEAARTHMALKGDVAQASASILQAPQMPGTAMDEKIAFNAVSNMLWVDSTNPMTQTYQAFPMPNNPGLVRVGFATDPPTTVIMPAATYEQLDTWRSIIQSEMMNGKYNDAIAAQTTKNEEDAAGAAQQAEVEALPEKLPSYFGPIYPTE